MNIIRLLYMNNIQESSKKIKKIYDNLSYFDQYGGQVFLFIILSILVFIVYSYCAVMLNIQPIKDNWATQRCNPKVIPFAGFINKKPGQTISQFTQENFTYCVQNILKSITGYAVQPLTYITSMLENIYLAILNDIQKIRQMIDNVRNSMAIMAKEVMGRILNMKPTEIERFVLRVLLVHVKGPQRFLDLKTLPFMMVCAAFH